MIICNNGKAVSSEAAFVFLLLLAGAGLLVLSGCSRNDTSGTNQPGPSSTLHFRVDDDLVAPPVDIPEIGISVRPPVNWEVQAFPVQEDVPIRVLHLFVGSGPAYLLVGILESDGSAEETVASFATSEDDELTSFTHNNIRFHQVRRVSPEHVSFSILFDVALENTSGPGILQFVIPTAEAESQARLIESSLGSVESL